MLLLFLLFLRLLLLLLLLLLLFGGPPVPPVAPRWLPVAGPGLPKDCPWIAPDCLRIAFWPPAARNSPNGHISQKDCQRNFQQKKQKHIKFVFSKHL